MVLFKVGWGNALGGGVEMAAQSYVDQLLSDARLVAEYSAAISDRLNAKLVAAIDAVERLPAVQRTLSAPAVTELYDLYEKSREQVPFKQFYALRNGWRVFPSRWQRRWTAIMVVAAILFMIGTLHLTRIYNRGVDISAALTVLEVSEAEIRFGELERGCSTPMTNWETPHSFRGRLPSIRSPVKSVRRQTGRVRNSTGATSSFFLHGKPLTGC